MADPEAYILSPPACYQRGQNLLLELVSNQEEAIPSKSRRNKISSWSKLATFDVKVGVDFLGESRDVEQKGRRNAGRLASIGRGAGRALCPAGKEKKAEDFP